jgi:hypothetical protein
MNLLIVESKNDKVFIEALLRHIQVSNVLIDDAPICSIDDYECLDGLSKAKLSAKLKDIKTDIRKKDIRRVGIIIDSDQVGIEGRIALINDCLLVAFNELPPDNIEAIKEIGQFVEIEIDANTKTLFSCYVMNLNGFGELETVLKAIKTQPSLYADCLDSWRKCLADQQKTIKDKDFDKFWVSNYVRFDTCSKDEQTQAGRKCSMSNFDYVMENKPQIFDFGSDNLEDLRQFLQLFQQ